MHCTNWRPWASAARYPVTTKDSIPWEVTRNISCGVAFAVADHVANDGLLGSGKYKAGIRATELRMKTDRGTCVAVGLTDATFELVRTFYIPFEDEIDDVPPVIAHAMTLLAEAGRDLTTTGNRAAIESAPVDPLTDIADAMSGERLVRTQVVLSRLTRQNPTEYEAWTFRDLAPLLSEYGVDVVKSGGVKVIRAEDIEDAICDRRARASDE